MAARSLVLMAMPGPMPTPAPPLPTAAPTRGERPLGVTLLAVLYMLGGLLFLLGSAALLGGAALFASFLPTLPAAFTGALFAFLGVVVFLVSLLYIAMGYGQWQGLPWAWTGSMALAVLGVVFGVLSVPFGLVGLAVNGFLLWYFTQEGVKRWFGKAA